MVKNSIEQIAPEIDTNNVKIDQSLRELGVNSIDSADIIIMSMENLNLKIPLVEFGKLKNIEGIVDFLYEKANV